ncbi:MAG: hypothetical protein HC839_01390 [Leptolyngbyaceae cyanobacterium RM2_2_21]|nr:hypothetical protein [Leptolyngbyaceae cyanobacterium RM2_2_21]
MLRSVSAQAWNKTESLLANEMQRHRIQPQLVDPWAIAKDVHYIYEKPYRYMLSGQRTAAFYYDFSRPWQIRNSIPSPIHG